MIIAMETEEILRLIETVSHSSITNFEYQKDDMKLVLQKKSTPVYVMPDEAGGQPDLSVSGKNNPVSEKNMFSQTPSLSSPDEIVRSPLVGTFYAASSEDAQPYVKQGDHVTKGQILGLIESMKLMNEIECPRDGVISSVLIENEQVVEYGQPLFQIR